MNHCRRILLHAFFVTGIPVSCLGQGFSFGVVGGMELTSDFAHRVDRTFIGIPFENIPTDFRITHQRSRFAPKLGLKMEYAFTRQWSVESGILIHRPSFTITTLFEPPIREFPSPDSPRISRSVSRYDEAIWEVPLLATRTFSLGNRTLILQGGPSIRPFGGIDGPGRFGMTMGVGTRWNVNRVRLQPSIRYTRWSDVRQPYTPAPFRRDELTVLLAVDAPGRTWRGAS